MKNLLLFVFFLLQSLPTLGMYADDEEIKQCYQDYIKNPKKFREKLHQLEKFSNSKEPRYPLSHYYLGKIYEEGTGVSMDIDKALEYFYNAAWGKDKKAFEKLEEFADPEDSEDPGNPLAQYYLGVLYETGIKKDIDRAIRCFYNAAWSEDKQAFEKLKKFADSEDPGNPLAQYYLGVLYEKGNGIKKDIDTAIKYFYDAAWNEDKEAFEKLKGFADKPNFSKAQYYLASIYYCGKGVDKNLEKAAAYGLKAAREVEKYREDLLKETKNDEKYHRIIKNKECEYLNNKGGSLENSLGRVTLFRGIHYVTNLFDADTIKTNKNLNDVDTFLVSSAACTLTGKKFLAGIPGEAELKAGKLICKILKKFKAESEILYNKFHETYTNDHEQFHDCLATPEKGKDAPTRNAFKQYRWVFQNFAEKLYPDTWKEAVKRNPFVSFSCNAEHGLKYAVGQKSFTGGADVKLSPNYDKEGKPKNKYLGKLYTAILSPADIWKLNPTFVVDKHAKNKVKISTHPTNNILTENEISFSGYVPTGLIKSSAVITVDDLPKEEKKNYEIINKYFNIKNGRANQIINEKSPVYEAAADTLVGDKNYFRIYFDIFESFYTPSLGNSDFLKTAEWLHSINARNSTIASSPIQGTGGATKNSIQLLATNLMRQPLNLEQNWANCLKKISISLCDLEGAGTSFAQILKNSQVSLEKLSLASCKLTVNDTKQIAACLKDNKYLRNLILDNNKVEDEGAKTFASSLKSNRALQELSLYDTEIKDITCFTELFPKGGEDKSLNKTLTELKLNYDLNQQHLKKIQKGLNRNLNK